MTYWISILLLTTLSLLIPSAKEKPEDLIRLDIPSAFEKISSSPELILLQNDLSVPLEGGHLQGIQSLSTVQGDKLIISGSSAHEAYLLQAHLRSLETESYITLMTDPFRHAGGFQISDDFLIVGIEDNVIKEDSKVCIYDTQSLEEAIPLHIIERKGAAETQTAGATGIISLHSGHLVLVANWDSRNWDFYHVDLENQTERHLLRWDAPPEWPGYQTINLIEDHDMIYAIGLYKAEDSLGGADLIEVSKKDTFKPNLKRINTRFFRCTHGVDFATAAGIQVDDKGNLHIWATQRDAEKTIAVHRFSQER